MSEREYRISRQMNGLMVFCAIVGLLAGFGTLAAPILDAEARAGGKLVFVLLTGPLYLAGGWYCLQIVLRGRDYGLAFGPSGFRRLSDSPMTIVSWARVARLRERRMLNRVEMLDHAGRVLGRMEYQLEGFEEALATMLAATRYEQRLIPLPQRLEAAGARGNRLAWVLMAGLVTLGMAFDHIVPAVLLGMVLLWAYAKDRRTLRQALHVDRATIRLTTAAGSVTLPLDALEDVRIVRKPVGNGGFILDVALATRRGEVYLARPGFADVFLAWAMLSAARRHAHPEASPVDSQVPVSPIRVWRSVVALGALGVLVLGARLLTMPTPPPLAIGSRVPEVIARDLLTREPAALSDFGRGRVVVLSFWHHECRYCRGQLSALDSVRRRVDSSRVRVVAIHLQDGAAAGARLARELGLEIVVWEDVDGAAATRFGIEGTPATAVIDPGGCVRYLVTGTGGVDVDRLVRAVGTADRAGVPCFRGESDFPSGDSLGGLPLPSQALRLAPSRVVRRLG